MSSSEQINTPAQLASRYRFIKLIGEGSSGKTFLAEQFETGKQVAVKILKFSLIENFKSYELFKREAEVLKSIHVNGVPCVYECVVQDNASELSYIVQDYIEYPSLMSILDEKKKLTETEILAILEPLADIIFALQTNYVPPIIHRDIKPSNILCDMQEPQSVKVALIDFGAVANPQKRNVGSTIAGTFGYMAPEQMLNDVAIQSDYYAIGATALHLLTGVLPYEMASRDNAFELDLEAIIEQYAPETSLQLRALLAHLLETKAIARPLNASVLKDEIVRVRQGLMPKGDSLCEKQSSKGGIWHAILRFLKPRPKKVIISDRQLKKWVKANGTLHCVNRENERYGVEYTFDANDRTWCGFTYINSVYKYSNLPRPCTVLYNSNDPRFNKLVIED